MKVLIVGSGGREHAIAWKVAQNPLVEKIYCAPGNGGTAVEEKCENVHIKDIEELADFAEKNKIDLTIVGPEDFLIKGIVDKFEERNLKIFGPSKDGAMLEGSKAYSKDFMKKYGIKTAAYEVFEDKDKALDYIKSCEYPVVVKADGLAAGKGVVICETYSEAESTIIDFMVKDIFKGSGKRLVIEEFLEGVEASILSITDGETIIPFISAKDHKQIYDGGNGPNTGGMGAICPNPYCTEEILSSFKKNIMEGTLRGIKSEGLNYIGIIFFGIMITKKGVYLLEYNVRMGDPETQAVLPLMATDFVDLIQAALDKKLSQYKVEWNNGASCCVVAASGGYPSKYDTGFVIEGLNHVSKVFGAGIKYENDIFTTSGGRVLSVQSLGKNMEEARKSAYDNLRGIDFQGIYFRKDIGIIE